MTDYTIYPANIDRLRTYRSWHLEQAAQSTDTEITKFHNDRVTAIDRRWDFHHQHPKADLRWWHPSFSVMEDEARDVLDLKMRSRQNTLEYGKILIAVEDSFDEIRAMREASHFEEEDDNGRIKRKRKPDVKGEEKRPVVREPIAMQIELSDEEINLIKNFRASRRRSLTPHLGGAA